MAANRCDWRGAYGIVRSLSGLGMSAVLHPVRKKDGLRTASECERQERWREHFRDVFRGAATTMGQLRDLPLGQPLDTTWRMTEHDTVDAWRRLGRNKGVGRDCIPAEFLQATADVMAPVVTCLYNEVVATEAWPARWTGGRMQDVFKHKGRRDQCDDYKGIVLEDHMAKGIKQHLSRAVMPAYGANQPDVQHGAVGGRSTDFAAHLVREVLSHAAAARLSLFILYTDLFKAFDRIIRKVTLGWPAGTGDAR